YIPGGVLGRDGDVQAVFLLTFGQVGVEFVLLALEVPHVFPVGAFTHTGFLVAQGRQVGHVFGLDDLFDDLAEVLGRVVEGGDLCRFGEQVPHPVGQAPHREGADTFVTVVVGGEPQTPVRALVKQQIGTAHV